MSNIRIFDIPDEVLENESYKRISRRLNATKKTDRDLCNHIISTANFVYMYCTQYEKEDTVDRSDAFVASFQFLENHCAENRESGEKPGRRKKTCADQQCRTKGHRKKHTGKHHEYPVCERRSRAAHP